MDVEEEKGEGQLLESVAGVTGSGLNAAAPPTTPLQPFIAPALPRYLTKYPEVYNAVQGVKDLVDEWRPDTKEGKFELEARLGKFTVSGFRPGVSFIFMEKVVSMLNTFEQWQQVTDWVETHDHYYTLERNKPQVRTTSYFEVNPKTGRKVLRTENIRKYNKRKLDYMYVSPSTPLPTDQYQYDLRVALNYEESVHRAELPSILNPSLVRIKSRKRYLYKSENFPSSSPIWSLDLTRSWTGKTKSEAEHKQKAGTTTYELEIECLNPKALMITPKHDHFYVACSLLLKMKDFIYIFQGTEGFKWDPIQKQLTATQEQVVACF
jgi:hypothetical protein